MTPLAYKKNAEETLARLRLLYSREANDLVFASFDIPTAALAEFRRNNPEGMAVPGLIIWGSSIQRAVQAGLSRSLATRKFGAVAERSCRGSPTR